MNRLTTALLIVCATASCSRGVDRAAPAPSQVSASPNGRLEQPFPIAPFTATDLDGRDVSTSTWKGRAVVVNVWATWCGPCRREMPALAALADKYAGRLLVIGLLQDNVTTDFARAFVRNLRIGYPIVRSTFEIESHFPGVPRLPMTFVMDPEGRLVATHLGEIDAAALERDLEAILPRPPTFVRRVSSNAP